MTISAVALVAVHAAFALGTQDAACSMQESPWTPSEVLWSGPWNERGPNPYSTAASATTIYVVAENPVMLAGTDSVRDGAMLGLAIPRAGRGGARVIMAPPRHLNFRYPKIVVDDSGTLHMVWVEATYSRGPQGTRRSDGVWAASYRNEKWTVERLAQLEGILWTATSVSDFVRSANGDLHLAVPAIRSSPLPYFLYVTRRAGRWMALKVPEFGGPGYTALATRHDSLWAGLILGALEGNDTNSLWLALSPDGGHTWQPPVIVSRSYDLAARELRIIPEDAGPIMIVWAQKDAPNEFLAGVVRIATSRDAGRTWAPPSTLKPPASEVYVIGAAHRAPGIVDALFSADDAITIARACGTEWGKPFALHDTLPATGLAALLDERGQRPQVFWAAPIFENNTPPTRLWLRSILR